jgi:GxxExxY protein
MEKEEPLYDEESTLTGAVIGAAIEVHRILGPGLLESIYQRCLQKELELRCIEALAQHRLPVVYKGMELGDDFVLDFFFPGMLIVELKTVSELAPVHTAQTMTYMKLSNVSLGLLINFNVPVLKDGLKRISI